MVLRERDAVEAAKRIRWPGGAVPAKCPGVVVKKEGVCSARYTVTFTPKNRKPFIVPGLTDYQLRRVTRSR
jgi:hypothetical protein